VPALDVDGVRLHYEAAGVGEAIVLLHGFASSYEENWVETGWVRRLLGEGFRVVGLDARGHGRSTKLYAPAGYETSVLAGDVVALLDRLHIDRAHAVGFSMGAGIALQLAMEHPSRVGAVVVAGIGDKAIRGLHDEDEISRIERGLKEGAENTGTDDLAGRIRRNAQRSGNDVAALAAFFERGGWPGDLTSIGPVTAPVLVVLAERDEFMPRADELLRRIPARVETLEDCAHAAAARDPRFVELALSFIREHRLSHGH
jgi:pimeloyl-ACP methyl ester carboxylesterase